MIVGSGYNKYGFDAYGDKVLKAEHMAYWMDNPQRVDPKGICFQLGVDIEEVEKDFFDLVPTIKELIILNPNCNVIMSDNSVALFKNNDVLIRGEFDSTAERLAKEYGLRFIHSDMELGYEGEYYSCEGIDSYTLRFNPDGTAYIENNNFCQGSSAGWSGGGVLTFDLPNDFYLSMNLKSIAKKCHRCTQKVISGGILKEFLKKAKAKGGFLIDYSKVNTPSENDSQ